MDYNNTVILATDKKHAKKIIEFYKSKGYDVRNYNGTINVPTFYGVISNVFDTWDNYHTENNDVKIITLPKKYPKVMMVSNNGNLWKKRVVFMEKNDKYIAWSDAETLADAEKEIYTCTWEHAKEIEEEQPTEITIEEIAKLLNKLKHLIKIIDNVK